MNRDRPTKQPPMDPAPPIENPGVTLPPGAQPPSTPTVSGLCRVPPEILIAIVSLFCAHCQDPTCEHETDDPDEIQKNLATLSAVSKTCKSMRVFAQPILHHNFAPISNSTLPAQLFCFVRTLLDRQDLANTVRVLGLDSCRWFECDPFGEPGKPGLRVPARRNEVGRMKQAASQFGLVDFEFRAFEWGLQVFPLPDVDRSPKTRHRSCGWEHADGCLHLGPKGCSTLTQLAISLCPNVKSVDFGRFTDDSAMAYPLGPGHQNKVELVRVRGEYYPAWHELEVETGWGFDMRRLAGLTASPPKLKRIQLLFGRFHDTVVDVAESKTDSPPVLASPPDLNLSWLTHLDLVLCTVSKNHLAGLLKRCVNLAAFTYVGMNHDLTGMSTAGVPESGMSAIQLHELTKVLQYDCPSIHKTLRRLALEHLPPLGDSYKGVYSSIDSLKGVQELYLGGNGLFSQLQDQSAKDRLLQILPPNIVVLHIFEARDWSQELSDALIELLEDEEVCGGRFKQLREIRVAFRPTWPWMKYWSEAYGCMEDGEDWLGVEDREDFDADAYKYIESLTDELGLEFCLEPNAVPPAVRALSFSRPESPMPRLIPVTVPSNPGLTEDATSRESSLGFQTETAEE